MKPFGALEMAQDLHVLNQLVPEVKILALKVLAVEGSLCQCIGIAVDSLARLWRQL